jgi:hypothetical protein
MDGGPGHFGHMASGEIHRFAGLGDGMHSGFVHGEILSFYVHGMGRMVSVPAKVPPSVRAPVSHLYRSFRHTHRSGAWLALAVHQVSEAVTLEQVARPQTHAQAMMKPLPN